MKKILFMTVIIAMGLCSCGGGKSGDSASGSGSEGGTASGLADGKWPAAVYDKYGIPELKTNGKIVYTDFQTEGSYQYLVDYKGVTREEMLAWVNSLKEKGFRLTDLNQEMLEKRAWEHDIMLYQPEEGKDMRMRIGFDFENMMSFEYYTDDPNSAFDVVERDDEYYIDYNFSVSLNPINNEKKAEGTFEALGLTADDFANIPNVRFVGISGNEQRSTVAIGTYGDHQLTTDDLDAIHNCMADVLAAKGVAFTQSLSGKACTADQLKADKIRSYGVEKDGKKYLMMVFTDDSPGDFGASFNFVFTNTRR